MSVKRQKYMGSNICVDYPTLTQSDHARVASSCSTVASREVKCAKHSNQNNQDTHIHAE